MKVHAYEEQVSAARVALAAAILWVVGLLLGWCYATVMAPFPSRGGIWIARPPILLGGLLGRSSELVVRGLRLLNRNAATFLGWWTGLWELYLVPVFWVYFDRHQFVWRPDRLAVAMRELAERVPEALAGRYGWLTFSAVIVLVMAIDARWNKHGFCHRCQKWCSPQRELGQFRHSPEVLSGMQTMAEVDFGQFPDRPPGAWKWLVVTECRCPGCDRFATLEVVRHERHWLGEYDRQVLLLEADGCDQDRGEVGFDR